MTTSRATALRTLRWFATSSRRIADELGQDVARHRDVDAAHVPADLLSEYAAANARAITYQHALDIVEGPR